MDFRWFSPSFKWTVNDFPHSAINVFQLLLIKLHRFMIGQYVTAHGDVIAHVNITHVMVEDGGGKFYHNLI